MREEHKMLKYETMVARIASRKAGLYLAGGWSDVSHDIAMVAEIYRKRVSTVAAAVAKIYPSILKRRTDTDRATFLSLKRRAG